MRTLGRGKEVLMPVQRILAQPSSCATQPRPTDATSLKHPGEASLCTCMPQKCQCRATALPVRSPILSLDRNLSVPTSPERCATGDCARGWFCKLGAARLEGRVLARHGCGVGAPGRKDGGGSLLAR